MSQRGADKRLVFEALRDGIERCDPDRLIGLYAEHAHLSIVNADVPQTSPFELRGRSEIAKHLRATTLPETSRRVEKKELIAQDGGVKFQEECEYSDGVRIVVDTTLEVRSGKIVRQVDVVTRDTRADSEDVIGRRETKGEEKRGNE